MDTSHAKKNPVRQGVLDDVVGYHVARARVTTQAMFLRHVGQPLELRPVDYSLLMLLDANTRLTPKQLAQALALLAPNLTILLDRMQERGLIERIRSESGAQIGGTLYSDALAAEGPASTFTGLFEYNLNTLCAALGKP